MLKVSIEEKRVDFYSYEQLALVRHQCALLSIIVVVGSGVRMHWENRDDSQCVS